MDVKTLVPAIFLYTEGREKIDGATRFQKMVFLAQEEGELSDMYRFDADKYGPFSAEFAQQLDALRAEGIIELNERENQYGQEKHVYALTTEGIQRVQQLLRETDSRTVFDAATEVKDRFNDWNLERLLRYVYNKYPDYTTDTELDTDRLFDPDARSVFEETSSYGSDAVGSGGGYRSYLRNASVFENEDSTWTARDENAGLTALGDTRDQALTNLGEVIAAAEGEAGHEPTDEEIRALGGDPDSAREAEDPKVPEYME